MAKCLDCGNRCKAALKYCNRHLQKREKERNDKAVAIVNTGYCPDCGSSIRRNNALTGWYQCSQFGADGFRADSTKPACGWQIFAY